VAERLSEMQGRDNISSEHGKERDKVIYSNKELHLYKTKSTVRKARYVVQQVKAE
jgi:hypothetical protein